MATMTMRNLDDQLKQRLRVRTATHGRSMEDEARDILRTALATQPSAPSLIEAIRARVDPLGGIELDIPAREAIRSAMNLHE